MSKLKKLSMSLLKSLTVILIISLVFSYTASDLQALLTETFSDIYNYGSPNSQKSALGLLEKNCRVFSTGKAVSVTDLCYNESLLQTFKLNCAEYRKLKQQGIDIPNKQDEEQIGETCYKIESRQIEKDCEDIRSRNIRPDTHEYENICNSYYSGEISKSRFFARTIIQSVGNVEDIEESSVERYNQLTNLIQNSRLFIAVAIFLLVLLMFVVKRNAISSILEIGRICFSVAMIIFIPFIIVLLYEFAIGIDTSSILDAIVAGDFSFDIKDPKLVFNLAFPIILKIYDDFIVTAGIIFLAVGVGGKIAGAFISENEHEEHEV